MSAATWALVITAGFCFGTLIGRAILRHVRWLREVKKRAHRLHLQRIDTLGSDQDAIWRSAIKRDQWTAEAERWKGM